MDNSDERHRNLAVLAEHHRPLMGVDGLQPADTVVALWRDHMDFHPYLHLTGFSTETEAWEFLTAQARDDDEDERVAVGVLALTGPADQAFKPAELTVTAGQARPISQLGA